MFASAIELQMLASAIELRKGQGGGGGGSKNESPNKGMEGRAAKV